MQSSQAWGIGGWGSCFYRRRDTGEDTAAALSRGRGGSDQEWCLARIASPTCNFRQFCWILFSWSFVLNGSQIDCSDSLAVEIGQTWTIQWHEFDDKTVALWCPLLQFSSWCFWCILVESRSSSISFLAFFALAFSNWVWAKFRVDRTLQGSGATPKSAGVAGGRGGTCSRHFWDLLGSFWIVKRDTWWCLLCYALLLLSFFCGLFLW